mgnify:CR=1 FL=1
MGIGSDLMPPAVWLTGSRQGPVTQFRPSSRFLSEVTEPPANDGPTGQRGLVPGDHVQQARLPGTVATNHARLVAGSKGQGQTLEDRSAGDLHGQVADLEHEIDSMYDKA